MKKRLCLKGCIHAEKREIPFTPVWLHTFKPTPKIKLPDYGCKFSKCFECYQKDNCEIWETIERELNKDYSIYCNFYGKGIRKYLTECTSYANFRLTDKKRSPEYLPKKPFEKQRECTICKGKGYVIYKDYEPHFDLNGKRKQTFFTKEKCVVCEGRGYKRQIPNIDKKYNNF